MAYLHSSALSPCSSTCVETHCAAWMRGDQRHCCFAAGHWRWQAQGQLRPVDTPWAPPGPPQPPGAARWGGGTPDRCVVPRAGVDRASLQNEAAMVRCALFFCFFFFSALLALLAILTRFLMKISGALHREFFGQARQNFVSTRPWQGPVFSKTSAGC